MHLIITCHCAIPDEATAKSSAFRFNHIDDEYEAGKIKGTDLFNMKDKWFWTNEVRPLAKRFVHIKLYYVLRILDILLLNLIEKS